MANRIASAVAHLPACDKGVTITVYPLGDERYIFAYDDAHRAELLRLLGRFASDPDLSLGWSHVAEISKEVRTSHG